MQQPTIPGYEILAKIAEGGTATVWKAKQTSLDRLVALKVLNKGLIKSEADIERFRSEARSAAGLRHPGLCQIYDAGEAEGTVYYVMEYVAGFSVANLLARKGDLPEKQALMIAYGVATVLGAIWEKNRVVHCDVKPDNILIDQDGTIRITDLGVARMIGYMAQNVDADYIVGTPNYASPEQARGLEDLDCRTDVYGLGATLYHMLTGLMPFADSEGEAAMERQIGDYVADPQAINPSVSIHAAWLVEKMMIKDRTARYRDWSEVIRDMDEVRAGRLPRGELSPPGHSTVSRGEERETETVRALEAMKPKTLKPAAASKSPTPKVGLKTKKRAPVAASEAGAKPRLKTPVRQTTYTPPHTPAKAAWPATLQKTFLLGLLVALAYGGTFYWMGRSAVLPEPASAVAETAPPAAAAPLPAPVRPAAPRMEAERAPVTPPPPAPSPAPRPAASRPEPPPAAAPPAATEEEEAWDHPDYREAMRLLRQADAALQEFLQSRDQRLLAQVEPDCRKAIELLEAVRGEAPARARIGERIRQSYQLIHNARQSRVLGN